MAAADFSRSNEKLPKGVGKNSQSGSTFLTLAAIFLGGALMVMAEGAMSEQEKVEGRLDRSGQLFVVTTADWGAVDGELRRFERAAAGQGRWKQVGGVVPVVVGRNGLAWAADQASQWAGMHSSGGPIKREGDGKSPAGLFSLSAAFGYADQSDISPLRMPYLRALPSVVCVDDPASRHYNRIVDRAAMAGQDWQSAEQMRREDDQYRWGVVVDHNFPATRPGDGSCIFLHIWEGRGKGTAGCTAMESARMEEILKWLDAASNPLLIQLPDAEYRHWRKRFHLP